MGRLQYGKCARPGCPRRIYAGGANRYGACHVCKDVIEVVEWLLTTGVLSVGDKAKADAMGLWYPGKK